MEKIPNSAARFLLRRPTIIVRQQMRDVGLGQKRDGHSMLRELTTNMANLQLYSRHQLDYCALSEHKRVYVNAFVR